MPPKFKRHLDDVDLLGSQNSERDQLLNERGHNSDEDEDFFLRSKVAQAANNPHAGSSSAQSNSNLSNVQGQVNEVVDIMRNNIGKVMERGENLEDLYDKSANLNVNADQFRSRSQHLRRKMWWRDCKTKLLLATVVITLLLIIIVPIIIQHSKKSDGDG